MIQQFYFVAMPYLALIVMLLGTVSSYREKIGGYKFTALSSQFLETKKLFWGSVPFHVGIVFLFFGHLIGFLIPQSVLIWNTNPLRLFALEISAFAFGLCILVGMIVLVYRRLATKKLHIVTSRMDILLYALLLFQVVTGLMTAYFNRWGSSWFASSMAPYLWSIIKFQPDMEVINTMPLMVKLHVSSAFAIIFAIPFSRFRHFLVFPLEYLYRSYHVVIWNKNMKKAKISRAIREGVKATNN